MDARRFLFVSADAALIADLAWQVRREGHDVRYYVEAESDREIGDGFVPKTDDWRASTTPESPSARRRNGSYWAGSRSTPTRTRARRQPEPGECPVSSRRYNFNQNDRRNFISSAGVLDCGVPTMALTQTRNVELLDDLYAAFNDGDTATMLDAMADDVEWIIPEGAPYGGTHVGPGAVASEVFERIPRDVDSFRADPDRFVDGGDTVVAEGSFTIVSKWGQTHEIPFVHVWDVDDGRITRFVNHTDTHLMRRAFGI
jgi:ketosteroid isomerase-like protein